MTSPRAVVLHHDPQPADARLPHAGGPEWAAVWADARVAARNGPLLQISPRSRAARRSRREIAVAVRAILAARPGAPHAIPELAAAVGVSPFHLSRLFRDEVGVPIHQYLLRLRLAIALDRLAGTAHLGDLAFDLGFSSHSHFTTAFRRTFGATPSEVRRALAAGAAAPPPARRA